MKIKDKLSLENLHPDSEIRKQEIFDEIATEFTEIMESEQHFFLFQQIQDRTQILESKKKQFTDFKSKYDKEVKALEKRENEIDRALAKAQFELKVLSRNTGTEDTGSNNLQEVCKIL